MSLSLMLDGASRTTSAKHGNCAAPGSTGQEKRFELPDDVSEDVGTSTEMLPAAENQANSPDTEKRQEESASQGHTEDQAANLLVACQPELLAPTIDPVGEVAAWQSVMTTSGQVEQDVPAAAAMAPWASVAAEVNQAPADLANAGLLEAQAQNDTPLHNGVAPAAEATGQESALYGEVAAQGAVGGEASAQSVLDIPPETATAQAETFQGQAADVITTTKATATAATATPAVTQSAESAEPRAADKPVQGESLTEMVRQNAASAATEEASSEIGSDLQTQAELAARTEQMDKTRSQAELDAIGRIDPPAAHATAAFEATGETAEAHQASAAASEPLAGEPTRSVDQIIENVRQAVSNGQREITINLNPPELGQVRLRMYTEGDEIIGRLDVDNPRTLNELQHQTGLLAERLAADGIALRRLDVHQMEESSSQSGNSSGESFAQQQDASGQTPGSRRQFASMGREESPSLAVSSSPAEPTDEAGDTGRLNVWI